MTEQSWRVRMKIVWPSKPTFDPFYADITIEGDEEPSQEQAVDAVVTQYFHQTCFAEVLDVDFIVHDFEVMENLDR